MEAGSSKAVSQQSDRAIIELKRKHKYVQEEWKHQAVRLPVCQ